MPESFIEKYKLSSVPIADPAQNPSVDEILRTFDAVHEQAISELSKRTDRELDVLIEQPHPVFKTKLEAAEYASLHEMVHAGQIALLRRLMGKPALR
jgi:hypothetical protein